MDITDRIFKNGDNRKALIFLNMIPGFQQGRYVRLYRRDPGNEPLAENTGERRIGPGRGTGGDFTAPGDNRVCEGAAKKENNATCYASEPPEYPYMSPQKQ